MKQLVIKALLLAAFAFGSFAPQKAHAQSTEEQFQDIFITAGYAAAFGASLGAASLAFYRYPEDHLRDVAIGASLGFIGGSLFGTYMVLTPVMVDVDTSDTELLARHSSQKSGLTVSPIFDRQSKDLQGLGAGFQLALD